VVVLLVLGVLAVAGAVLGWWWYSHRQVKTAATTPAEQTLPAETPPSVPAEPVATVAAEPATTMPSPPAMETPPAAPVEQPATVPAATTASRPAAPSAPEAPPVPPIRIEPAPKPTTRTVEPEPEAEPPAREAPRKHAAPAPTTEQPSAPAAPREEEPAAPATPFDRELQTSTALKFDVEPESTVVSLKEEGDRRFTVIGRAGDYPASKRKMPAFDLPGPGIYYLRLYNEGHEVVFRLDARAGGAPTTIQYKGGR